MKPLVSIIVPVYNIEKYIRGCITSILSQTYKELQVVLVDDGTPDLSGKICDEFAQTDSRVFVIHKENGGLSSARNAGLEVATGDYIMFVDGDDYLVDNAVEILVRANEKYDADFVQFDTVHTTCPDYSYQHSSEEYNVEILTDLREMYWKMHKTLGPGVSACTKLHKKELFEGIRFKEGIVHEDDYLTLYMLQNVKKALYIDAKLYYYIVHENSILTSSFSKKKLDVLYVSECRMQEMERLGYRDLHNYENEQYFLRLANLWCSAKRFDNMECLGIIEEKLRNYNKSFRFSRKNELLYKISKANTKMLSFYYIYKKMTKHI